MAYAAPPDTFSIDTVDVEYEVGVEWLEEKQDTIRFHGLPGADKAYYSHLDNFMCKTQSRIYCDLDAHIYEDGTFEMYLGSPSGMYQAEGALRNGSIELEGNFFYRATSIDYFLSGEKVNR